MAGVLVAARKSWKTASLKIRPLPQVLAPGCGAAFVFSPLLATVNEGGWRMSSPLLIQRRHTASTSARSRDPIM
jgi:hypothetical protein